MRLTYALSAEVIDQASGEIVPFPGKLDGWVFSGEELVDYLDPDLADLGIIGGQIRFRLGGGQSRLEVTYWSPGQPTHEIIERLRDDTLAQMEDGVGEGGFFIDVDDQQLTIQPRTDLEIGFEMTDDGRSVPSPPRIAIAARDGHLPALIDALENDKSEIERTHQGHSALQLAIVYGHVEVVHLLIQSGADAKRLDPQGNTTLELCALSNSLDDQSSAQITRLLIDAGADASHVTPTGESVRSYALIRGKQRMAELL